MSLRLALEIGGTKFQAALGKTDGSVIASGRCAVPAGAVQGQLAALEALARRVLAGKAIDSVGIGFGGPVDTRSGSVVLSHHVPGWGGFKLADWAQAAFGRPCVIENDANAAALAEARLGAGAGAAVVFYTNIGSGIGGGLVIEGKLYSRPFGAAELGHTKLWDRQSGQYVIAEQLCSGWSINRMARQLAAAGELEAVLALAGGQVEAIAAQHVGQAAENGDAPALRLIERAAGDFAVALCNMITLLNPDRIVIGGGVSLMGELFLRPLRQAVSRQVFDIYLDNFRIVPAALGEAVVLVGALLI
jgi:glucokinase